jgi:ferredoxin
MEQTPLLCTIDRFHQLLEFLNQQGRKLIGPTLREDAIIYDEIQSAQDLPIGWTDEQEAGKYRLKRRSDNAYFGYNVGQHSWKKELFPPREKLWSATRKEGKIVFEKPAPEERKTAFIGVRACDLQAIFIQDKVFNHRIAVYEQYQQRREQAFILAVNCTTAAKTCFCASMGTGPAAKNGYDIALTEVIGDNEHYFVLVPGTAEGAAVCSALELPLAPQAACQVAAGRVEQTKASMARQVDNANIHEVLMQSWSSEQWDKVAERCINCANCTLVCPTCFCSDTEDKVSLDASHVERWQSWDSCFNLSHSYVHGGSIRSSAQSRYRQWLTHKFGTWWDQFGASGCVGCGRCITWCPVGIDVTEELNKLQEEYHEKNR